MKSGKFIGGVAAGVLSLATTAAFAQAQQPGSNPSSPPGSQDQGTAQPQGQDLNQPKAPDSAQPKAQDLGQGQTGSAAGQTIAGVVTSVDPHSSTLSIVAPMGSETEVRQVGQNLLIEKGVNYLAVNGPVATNTKVTVDGRRASLNDVKEGDVVRASFDSKTQTFSNINAVSTSEVKGNPRQAAKDLSVAPSQEPIAPVPSAP
jgi:hypothetical protein